MNSKIYFYFILLSTLLLSCKNKDGRFSVSGELQHADKNKIYLEQLFFSAKNPQVLDSATIEKGKFTLKAKSIEEGLYRLRIDSLDVQFIFINDQPEISFKGDLNDMNPISSQFNTSANLQLKSFINMLDEKIKLMNFTRKDIDNREAAQNDSSFAVDEAKLKMLENGYQNFITSYLDTCSDPILTMFSLGYAFDLDPLLLNKSISGLSKRFPKHQGIATVVTEFNKMLEEKNKVSEKTAVKTPKVGDIAPNFTMNDIEGKPFSLSQLKGKYVLVDFWASWCGPCRGENPNVVKAYNQFKNKNFTVLGVSLDEDKSKWLEAIKEDQLTWKHISDLKGWSSAVVSLFGFDGIPYNILVNPEGKIIATELRENDLIDFLSKNLK